MEIVRILPGANNKPAYIEFIKEENKRETLLSVESFRNRYGDDITNEVLGIEPEEEVETVIAEEAQGELSEGLFSVAS